MTELLDLLCSYAFIHYSDEEVCRKAHDSSQELMYQNRTLVVMYGKKASAVAQQAPKRQAPANKRMCFVAVFYLMNVCRFLCGWRHYTFWLFVSLCICESVCASQTLLTHYLEKYWTYFHQTFSIRTFWVGDESVKFWDQKVKIQGRGWWVQHAGKCTFGLGNAVS